jgi:hypothetical protein
VAFAATCGGGSYAVSLDQLKTPKCSTPTAHGRNDRPGLSADMTLVLGADARRGDADWTTVSAVRRYRAGVHAATTRKPKAREWKAGRHLQRVLTV